MIKAKRPFRLRPLPISEGKLHEAVVEALEIMLKPPAIFACYPAGHIRLPPREAAKLVRVGLRQGFPDLLFWHGGRSFGIELKTQAGRLTKTQIVRTKPGGPRIRLGQETVFPLLEAAGMRIAACRTLDDVLKTLSEWEIPLRIEVMSSPHAGAVATPNG